jgi:hypothetical protein
LGRSATEKKNVTTTIQEHLMFLFERACRQKSAKRERLLQRGMLGGKVEEWNETFRILLTVF